MVFLSLLCRMVNDRLPAWELESDPVRRHMHGHAHRARRRIVCVRPPGRVASRRGADQRGRRRALPQFDPHAEGALCAEQSQRLDRPGHALRAAARPHALRVRPPLAAQDRGRRIPGHDVGSGDQGLRSVADRLDRCIVPGRGSDQAVGRPAGREIRAGAQRAPGADHQPGAQAAGGQGDRPLLGKSVGSARLDGHRPARRPGHHRAVQHADRHAACRTRCSRTKAGAEPARAL